MSCFMYLQCNSLLRDCIEPVQLHIFFSTVAFCYQGCCSFANVFFIFRFPNSSRGEVLFFEKGSFFLFVLFRHCNKGASPTCASPTAPTDSTAGAPSWPSVPPRRPGNQFAIPQIHACFRYCMCPKKSVVVKGVLIENVFYFDRIFCPHNDVQFNFVIILMFNNCIIQHLFVLFRQEFLSFRSGGLVTSHHYPNQ